MNTPNRPNHTTAARGGVSGHGNVLFDAPANGLRRLRMSIRGIAVRPLSRPA